MRIPSDPARSVESESDGGSQEEISPDRYLWAPALFLLLALPLVAHDYGSPGEGETYSVPQRVDEPGERTPGPQVRFVLAALGPPTEQQELGAEEVPGALGFMGRDRVRGRYINPLASSERFLQRDVPYGGAIVEQVFPGSPAEEVGVQPGDVVLWQKGKRICKARDLQPLSAGDRAELVVARGGIARTFNLVARERGQVFRFNEDFGQAYNELWKQMSEEAKLSAETSQLTPKQQRAVRQKLQEKYAKPFRKLCDRVRKTRSSDAGIDRTCGAIYARSKKWKESIRSYQSASLSILAPDILYGLTRAQYNRNKDKRQEIQSAWDQTAQLLNSRERNRSNIRRIADERWTAEFRTNFPDQTSKTAREEYLALLRREGGCQQAPPSAPAVDTLLTLGEPLELSKRHAEAFGFYREALSLWDATSSWRESMKIRAGILKAVGKMNAPPAIPDLAKHHSDNARREFENARNVSEMGKSVTEFRRALLEAPWWAGGYYNSAIILAKMDRYDEALDFMDLYLRHAERMGEPEEARRKLAELRVKKREYEALQSLQGDWNTHLGTYSVSLRGRGFRATGVNQNGCKTTFIGTALGRTILGNIILPRCKHRKIACVVPGGSVPFEGKISANHRTISIDYENPEYHFKYEAGLAGLIGGFPCISVTYRGTNQVTMYLSR